MLFVNSGTSQFLESAYLSGLDSTDWTWSVKFSDLDADGLVDLFITNGMTRDFQNSDLKNESLAAQKEQRLATPHDFWEELPMLAEPNKAFRNGGDLKFTEVSSSWGIDNKGVSLGSAFGDLDGDGDLDIVVNNFTDLPSIYRNDLANGVNHLQVQLVGTQSNRSGVGAELRLLSEDVKQMRQVIVSRGYMSSDEPLVHFGLGNSTVADRLEIRWPSGIRQVVEHLTAGRRYTVVEPSATPTPPLEIDVSKAPLFVASPVADALSHEENNFDDFEQQPLLPNRLSRLGPDLAAGDVDGDGAKELYLGGAAGHSGKLFKLSEGEYLPDEIPLFGEVFADEDAAAEDMGVLFFDADGDGDLDLYVASGGVENDLESPRYRDRFYVNDGKGGFTKAPEDALPNVTDSSSCVVSVDYDRDGDLDLFVGGRVVPGQYPLAPKSRLLKNESSAESVKFEDATTADGSALLETGMVTAAVWADVDGDEWPDLMVAHEWGPVKVFINEEGHLSDRTAEYGLDERKGWWTGIAAADLDHDGDQDFIVTNFGSNTKYHPSPDHPALIYYNDFDDSGKHRIVEAKLSGDNELLPVRGRSCSSNAIPLVAERFGTFHEFAMASLADIYTPECLDDAIQLTANELRSGVLLNQGVQGFEFQPLPTLAQLAPGFDVAISDVNGDGNPDAFIAQNFFGAQRETGRMAGGLGQLLLGDGKGEFQALWPHESGVVVPEDSTAAVVVDFSGDGGLDLVLPQIMALPSAFKLQRPLLEARIAK